ncbi:MAG: hypothetical protein QNJ03_07140 [Dinoroseobacter sp.]|nr:hypothetical protein [Dinoroseobacter sp.]
MTLVQTSFKKAVWTGRLKRKDPGPTPALRASLNGTLPLELEIAAAAGLAQTWNVQLRVPDEGLTEGTHLILIEDQEACEILYRIPIIAGIAASDDMRAEIAALRAELDQLRSAFRTAMRSRSLG